MPDPAFFVEGQMEKKIVQQLCPSKPVRLIGANGDNVTMAAMAKHLAPNIRLLGNRCHPIIIIFDRERRDKSCDELRDELQIELANNDIKDEVIVTVVDRTIENWILADIESLYSYYHPNTPVPNNRYEGLFGKSELKKILPDHEIYKETTTGVHLFMKANPQVIYQNDSTFRQFVSSLTLDCWWLDQIDEH